MNTDRQKISLAGADMIFQVFEARMELLAKLGPAISRKLYFQLEEKLALEKREMEKLLGLQKGQQDTLSKYTFILDSQYFEQTFLN